jgi:hypothetical protein
MSSKIDLVDLDREGKQVLPGAGGDRVGEDGDISGMVGDALTRSGLTFGSAVAYVIIA